MKDLIEQWKQNEARKHDENFDFLMWLKAYKTVRQVDKIAKESHDEVFSMIDCTNCANCCKTTGTSVSRPDIERISAFLQISEEEFIETYLTTGDENEYEINALPCPFLKDDKCGIYEVRPTVCREYPHTDKKEFITRKYLHSNNMEICPAVYHIFETMKYRFNWRKRK